MSLWSEMIDLDRGRREWRIGAPSPDERIHPVAVQPKKSDGELPEIIPIRTDRKSPRSP
jgi:hypothetical protein